MPWFKRTDPDTFAGLAQAVGGRAQPLAFGTGTDVVLVGTRTVLALRRGGVWSTWPWQTVAGGAWKAETRTFRWRTVDGAEFEVVLEQENQLPQLFRERIEASTVVSSVIDAPPGRVQIVGRRSLKDDAEVHFYAVASGGADLADEPTRVAVVAETDRLKAEYF